MPVFHEKAAAVAAGTPPPSYLTEDTVYTVGLSQHTSSALLF